MRLVFLEPGGMWERGWRASAYQHTQFAMTDGKLKSSFTGKDEGYPVLGRSQLER